MKTKSIIFYLIGLLLFSSCDDMFEPAKENTRQLEALVQETDYVHGLLINAYTHIPDIYKTTTQTDVATDDAVTNLTTSSYLNMATGTWSAENNPMSQWNSCKDAIQYITMLGTWFLSFADKENLP